MGSGICVPTKVVPESPVEIITDTLVLARIERKKQGPYEAEISFRGEADLHKHCLMCEKNPEHENFIPVRNFFPGQLPMPYQDPLIVGCVQTLSCLTVRVTVSKVSPLRPETFPGTNTPYPGYNTDPRMSRYGTGWVCGVDKFSPDNNQTRQCQCRECQQAEDPETNFAHIYINTVAHVVFDAIEGAKTTCHLFFDEGSNPQTCQGVVSLRGMSSVHINAEADTCQMTYITHDRSLIDRLDNLVSNFHNKKARVREKYSTFKIEDEPQAIVYNPSPKPARKHNLTIIVAHPHGCSKQVSVGHFIHCDRKQRSTQYRYNTATCPGSSGAPLFLLTAGQSGGVLGLHYDHAHSGADISNFSNRSLDVFFEHHVWTSRLAR